MFCFRPGCYHDCYQDIGLRFSTLNSRLFLDLHSSDDIKLTQRQNHSSAMPPTSQARSLLWRRISTTMCAELCRPFGVIMFSEIDSIKIAASFAIFAALLFSPLVLAPVSAQVAGGTLWHGDRPIRRRGSRSSSHDQKHRYRGHARCLKRLSRILLGRELVAWNL
jgi:hypothetical protein